MADGFSYADTPETGPAQVEGGTDNTINMTTSAPVLPESVLEKRAARADFALGENSPGAVALKDAFKNGAEPIVRQTAAAQADIDFKSEKLKQIQSMVAQGQPVSAFEIDTLMALGQTPQANPETVFEDKFAKQMVAFGVAGDPAKNSVFQKAYDEQPDATREGVQKSQSIVSRSQLYRGVLEEATAAYDSIPWVDLSGSDQVDKLGSLMKGIYSMGFSTYVNQRNLLNSSPTNSILPGSNKLEQIQYLYLLPPEEGKKALLAAAGPGSDLWKSNPSDAMDFIQSAVQFATSDAYVDNAFAIANVSGLIPARSGLKALGRLIGGKEVTQPGIQSVSHAAEVYGPFEMQGPKRPEVQGPAAPNYFVPGAAVTKTDAVTGEIVPRPFSSQVGPDGKPRIFNEDGIEIELTRTNRPEAGFYPVEVGKPTNIPTFTNREGTVVHSVDADGKSIVNDRQTIYTDKKSWEKLSQVLDEEKDSILLHDDKGYYVGDRAKNGKEIRGSRVALSKIKNAPKEGLHPIHLTEGNDKMAFEDFGSRITHVDRNEQANVKLGAQVVADSDVQTRIALADIAKSQGETHPTDVLAKMGKHEDAAVGAAETKITDRFDKVVHDGDAELIRRNIPSIASPQSFFHNASSLVAGRATALAETAQRYATGLVDAILDPARVERLTSEALQNAITIAKQQVSQRYNRASDSILDQVSHWDGATNTYRVETRFGKRDKTLFDTYEQAKHFRDFQYRLKDSAEIKQEGTKFYLSHTQHVDETQSGVRGSLIVSGNETPRGFWNTLMNAVTGKIFGGGDLGPSIRSSAYTTAPFQRNNRTVATHAPSILKNAIESTAKDIGVMGKTERHELQQLLESNRDFMHQNGDRGQFYKSALEFETAFHALHGKMPTEKQIVAYDQFTRLSDFDWTLRAMDVHRDVTRQGVRNYRVTFKSLDKDGIPLSADTEWFNGKLVKDFDPVNTQNANIYVLPEGRLATKFGERSWDQIPGVKDKIKSGEYQIIQMYNPREKPLMAATGVKDDIHFVITDKYRDTAVKLGEGLEYRPGGHVIYQDPYFMKQPMIGEGSLGRITHFGDKTIKSFATEKEGLEWIRKYNTARNFLRAGDEAGLKAYIDAGHLPETVQDFKKLFTSGGADLNAEHPFVLTTAGRDSFQSNEELARQYPGLKDQYSSYNLSQTQGGAFLAERDQQLSTIANTGTEANPIYSNVPSRLYDPYTSLQKGMQEIVRSRWMSDYKMSAAESWVQEFAHLFDQSKLPIEKLRQNPVYWLYNAQGNLDKGVLKTNPELYTAAMVSRRNIMNFVGARDEVGGAIEGLQAKLVSSIESISGHKIAMHVSETALPKITDASTYARAWAFNAIDGMFNVVQLIQQGMGMTHAIAVSPVHGIQGTMGAKLARAYARTEHPDILADMANKAAPLGWKKEDFIEAWQAWKATGVHNIGGEQTLLSRQADPQLFKNGFSTFIDKGQMFFKAGEAWTRDVSFFTAYRDWKAANPNRVLDNRGIGEVMNRFDALSMNMTRASNASYNEGLMSIPTQFWSWNARFAEQMLGFGAGKQLTLGEKARAITLYSALYGIPSTLGGITFGLPNPLSAMGIPTNYNDMRQYALAHNLPVTEKWFQAFSEGIPTVLLNMLTGHDTSLHRFSPDANQITEILDGKKSIAEMLGGASGTFLAQIAGTVWPFLTYSFNAMTGRSQTFPLKWNDLANLAENVSSFNNAEKAVVGLNIGKYLSKTEGFQVPVDAFESVMLGLGLNPQRVNDAYTRLDYLKHVKSANEKLGKKITEDWKIALSAGSRSDYATMSDYMTRVNAWTRMGDFTMKEQVRNFKNATKGVNSSLVDSVNQRWIRELPQMQSLPRMKEYLDNMAKEK